MAWSRFRVLPLLDKSWPSVADAIDTALRRARGVPTYMLTDSEKTVVAGLPVRNPATVALGRSPAPPAIRRTGSDLHG
jgi:hypothetical protein